ncbi:MAG TPA: hypothetical protein VFC44_23200 [Candidatus Saccharimonadales bacterium]|nr:hypothetical protein [Candidatus Saccharimonadales bacterium]
MNALVKKEIRLLLPGFLIASALTLANFFVEPHEYGTPRLMMIISFNFCPAMAVWMALNSFGAEINSGTFSMLLAQPVSRQRIWRTKALSLAGALFLVCLLWCVFLNPAGKNEKDFGMDLGEVYVWAWLWVLAIYSGALWSVLLLRQVATAFWFTLLLPAIIMISVGELAGNNHADWAMFLTWIALAIYSLVGFFFARWLFLRAEDAQWTGGTLTFPELRMGSSIQSRAADRRFWRPRAALFWKELQLHQSQFVVAAALAFAHLAVIATRKFGNFPRNSMMEFVLESFWGLWLVMPMLVGATAVAEERKIGTLAAELCQPVKRHTQFAIKFCVALLLSMLFGIVIPLLLERSGVVPHVNWLVPWSQLAALAAAIGIISFFASTLARNTLQAIASAIFGLVVCTVALAIMWDTGSFFNYSLWTGALIYLIGIPTFGLVLLALSYWNFQRLNIGGQTVRRNLLVFGGAVAFVVITTTAIYHRDWERFTPFELPHGLPRLSLAHPPTLGEDWRTLSVRMPNGEVWIADYDFNTTTPIRIGPLSVLGRFGLEAKEKGGFFTGSNWAQVIRGPKGQRLGIKADGTLWFSGKWTSGEPLENNNGNRFGALLHFGSETNWSSVGGYGSSVMLVKKDGTLWSWGANRFDKHWQGLQSFTPHRLGTETNWAEVFDKDNQVWLRKRDGSEWSPQGDKSEFVAQPSGLNFFHRSRGWTQIRRYQLGVGEDGAFRIVAELKPASPPFKYTYAWKETDLPLGDNTHWLGMADEDTKAVTLKDDGSLWLWNFNFDRWRFLKGELEGRRMQETRPVRLGTNSDWIAITTAPYGMTALAADGSLWYWPLVDARNFYEESEMGPLLDISRKPQLLANIFSK